MVTNLTNTLHLAARKCGLKIKRAATKKPDHNVPWFNKECMSTKINMKELGKNVKKSPNENKYREELYAVKKDFNP